MSNLLSCPTFIAEHRLNPQAFSRKRRLTFKNIVLLLLDQLKSAAQVELDGFFSALLQLPFEQRCVTAQAFSSARKKLKPEVFLALNQHLQAAIEQFVGRKSWCGLRLLAIDGSALHLPFDDSCETWFGGQNDMPMARWSQLYDVLDQQVLHSACAPYSLDERSLAELHLAHVPFDSVLLFDRGYPAHWLLSEFCCEPRRHIVMRVKLDHDRAIAEFVASGALDVDHYSVARSGNARRDCRERELAIELDRPLRLLRIELGNGESEVLLTSLTDRAAFPHAQFAALYQQRWGIETDLRRFKCQHDVENFSGRRPLCVRQDAFAKVLLKNITQLFLHSQQAQIEQDTAQRQHRYQGNYAQALSRMKGNLWCLLLQPCLERLSKLLRLMSQCLSAVRGGRKFPHKRRRPATHGCEGYKPCR